MPTSHARVTTGHGSRYLTQLSKHWSHRFPELTYSAERADIPLPGGPCVLEADGTGLVITLRSDAPETLARMETVVAEHLQRFAFREPLAIAWTRAEAA
jgi:hypothetical protein